jgi:hypothetical protein
MEKTKHTPGPWEIEEREHSRRQVIRTKQGVITELINYGHAGGINAVCFIEELSLIAAAPDLLEACREALEELRANARLIAAAPDLLEACRAIAALMDGQGRRNLPLVSGMARAAIAKAEGMEGD